ncbi:ABC transporter ATP-binding protein [Pontibacter sp. 13R65]|uniref:ABC transporter ATP-binding protein n=1 Tax=Pontibacter sp. 13R65 TaxID=3127458 RepID=UPI00301DBC76
MDQTQQPILQALDLTIGYKKGAKREMKVAGPLQLTVYPGQLICLLGPNGAGKSTLIRTLAGLQPMLHGTVEITGESIHQLKPAEMARKLSMVLTEKVRTGNLNVYSLVALGRYPYTGWLGTLSTADKKVIHWAIEATKTAPFLHRKTDQLSDGENQKVMLARTLAQDTPLIILDEPTAHLDLPNRIELMRLLHQLARQTKKAILLSTHELDLALQAGDQVWLLDAEGKMKQGVPEDLVLDGSFEAAFDKAGFQFDKATGTFNMHEPKDRHIHMIGEGATAFWTRRALQREGFAVSGESQEDDTVEVIVQGDKARWVSKLDGTYTEHHTIADLLAALKAVASAANKAKQRI